MCKNILLEDNYTLKENLWNKTQILVILTFQDIYFFLISACLIDIIAIYLIKLVQTFFPFSNTFRTFMTFFPVH